MLSKIKTLFKNYFGVVILIIPLVFFFMCYLYSNKNYVKEKFSLGDMFNSKTRTNNEKVQTPPDFISKNIYNRAIPVDSSNFETNSMRNAKKTNGSLLPVGNSLFGNVQCRLLSDCNDGYNETGAEFEGIKCQNDTTSKQAKAVASIKNGYIDNIHLVDAGLGYTDDAKIMIVGGNGSDALCNAILDIDNPDKSKRTSIKKIEIKNSGRNYNSTPKVVIENPSSNHKCKLCSK
jgi:hypothetical protein